jgi:ABC transporter substrate binding protein
LGSYVPTRAVLAAFCQGLSETGYIEKQNITIEYRWAAQAHYDQLPALAADLARRKVSVIAATIAQAAVAAKTATASIPIVFETGSDLIKLGLVAGGLRDGNVPGGFAALPPGTRAAPSGGDLRKLPTMFFPNIGNLMPLGISQGFPLNRARAYPECN